MRYIIIAFVALVACEKTEINPLVGKWELKYYTQYGKHYAALGTVEFLPNGVFMVDSVQGNYRVEGDKIFFWHNQCGQSFRLKGDSLFVDYKLDNTAVYGSCLYDLDITTTLHRQNTDY